MTTFLPRRQDGASAVEFALLALFFFSFIVGMLEVARAMYLWNTSGEITRRLARTLAVTDFNDAGAVAQARQLAAFGSADGSFPLSGVIKGGHFEVSYLRSDGVNAVNPMPACPEQNLINCGADPDGASCIRFVRVRLCEPGGSGECALVPYPLMVKLELGLPDQLFFLPSFATLVPAADFGRRPGAGSSCP